MKCPACGNLEKATKIQDEILSYGGQFMTLHTMKGDFFPACGEGIWDEESCHRYTEMQTEIIRAVKDDGGGVCPQLHHPTNIGRGTIVRAKDFSPYRRCICLDVIIRLFGWRLAA